MNEIIIQSAPVIAALRADTSATKDLSAAIARRLPAGDMESIAFVLCARLALADREGRLAGFPPMVYAALETRLPDLARKVLPKDAADEAVKLIEASR